MRPIITNNHGGVSATACAEFGELFFVQGEAGDGRFGKVDVAGRGEVRGRDV